MGFMWGSFADGFTRGFQNGWDLGDKITTAMDKADFRNSVRGATDKADAELASLDKEKTRRTEKVEGNPESMVLAKDALSSEAPEQEPALKARGVPEMPEMAERPKALDMPVSTPAPAAPAVDSETVTQAMPFADSVKPTQALPREVREDPAGAMSTDEYLGRRQAIIRQRERDILSAQLHWAERDPEKYAEIQKKLYDMDTDDSIKEVIEGLQKNDPHSIGVAVKTLQEMGFIEEGATPQQAKDGSIELVSKDGKVLWNGQITPQMIKQGIPIFAMAAKAKADHNYEKLFEIQSALRTRRREDAQDARAERQLNHSIMSADRAYALQREQFGETKRQNAFTNNMKALEFDHNRRKDQRDYDLKLHQQDVNDYKTYATLNGYGVKGGSGAGASGAGGNGWTMSNLPAGVKLAEDEAGNQIVQNTKTGEVMGRYNPQIRNAVPAYKETDAEKQTRDELSAKGWQPGFAFDDSGRVKYTMVNPKNGQYVFADDPTHIYESAEPQRAPLPPFPWRTGSQASYMQDYAPASSERAHTSVTTTQSETQKAQAQEAPAQTSAPADPKVMQGPDAPVAMEGGMPEVPQMSSAEQRIAQIDAQMKHSGWSWPLWWARQQAVADARRERFGGASEAAPVQTQAMPTTSPQEAPETPRTALQGPDVPVAMEGGMPGIPRTAPTSQAGYDPADFYREYADVRRPPEGIGDHLATDEDRAVTAKRAAAYDRNGPTEYADHEYKYGASRAYGAPVSGADDFYRQYENGTVDRNVDPKSALHASSYAKGTAGRYQTAEAYDDEKPRTHETAPTTKTKKTAMDDFYKQYSESGYGGKRGALDPIKKTLIDIEKQKFKSAVNWGKTEAEENKESEDRIKAFPKILKDAQKPRAQDRKRPLSGKDYRYPHEKEEAKLTNKKFDVSSKLPLTTDKDAYKRGSIEYDLAWRMASPALAELIRNDVDINKLNARKLRTLWKTVLHGDARMASDQFFEKASREIKWCFQSVQRNKLDPKKWAEEESKPAKREKYMKVTVKGAKIA